MANPRLVMIPTYNEAGNVDRMYGKLDGLKLQADILFIDDNSPDGTGSLLDSIAERDPKVHVIHRPGKQGIGAAHLAGIRWAYARGYNVLITLDCDFTHNPEYLQEMLSHVGSADVVIGSRHLGARTLQGWGLHRKFLTKAAHLMTNAILGLRCDATTSLRLYDLNRIPRELFDCIQSSGFAFFFESAYFLSANGVAIREIPVVLAPREAGTSKVNSRELLNSLVQFGKLFLLRVRLARARAMRAVNNELGFGCKS